MEAKSLNCPMCGAAARNDASRCDHCGARLAAVACPSCFNLMFRGAKFCSNCGALAQRAELEGAENQPCPRCVEDLLAVDVGGTRVRECAKCDGLWIDNPTFEEICRKREQQAVFMGMAFMKEVQTTVTIEPVRYLKCPACRALMNRINFAGCSGVVVDVCKPHGTWFDRAELRRIIDFIQAGGMDKARDREIRALAEKRRPSADRPGSAPTVLQQLGDLRTGTRSYSELDIIGWVGELATRLLR